MTKSPQRARDASKPKPATIQRKNVKRTSEAPRADSGPFVKTDITPEDFFMVWSRERREALIEILIASLDTLDGDTDLEPDLGSGDDREGDDADLEDTADDEPSLGWRGPSGYLGESTDQSAPDFYGNADAGVGLEDEHDGCEPEIEEPSLGWPEVASQDRDGWTGGCHGDAELDQADAEPSLGWTDNPKQSGLAWEGHPYHHRDEEATSPEWPEEHPTWQPPKQRVVAPPVPVTSIKDCVRVSR